MDFDFSNSKIIKDFERYLIDVHGNVYDTKIKRCICQWVDNVGYYQCILYKDGKKNYRRVHRLEAIAFLDNERNLPQVNHKDGNKLNLEITNLEWIDNSSNTKHGYDKNLYQFKSRKHRINTYTKDGVFYKQFESIRSMCDELRINRKTVTAILKGCKTTNNYDYLFEYAE